MNCEECEKLIDDYISGGLDDETTDSFVKHVLGCPSCLEELRINYSVLTALDQMDKGDELSEDYDAELNEKIVRYVTRKKRKRQIYAGMCVLTFVLSIFVGILFSAFFLNRGTEQDVVYGTDLANNSESDNTIGLGYEGVPAFMDPVEQNISKYNYELIDYLHSLNSDNS